jgi:molybdopterin converting factor small subunit
MATVIIPIPLRKFTNNTAMVTIVAKTVAEAVNELSSSYPNLYGHLVDTSGKIRPFINIFVDNNDIRHLQGPSTGLATNATVIIVPAIAGGILDPRTQPK